MFEQIVNLLATDFVFFFELLREHMIIAGISVLIAIALGGIIGAYIAEHAQTSKPTLAIINFLYTIPSISMLGLLIPLSGIGNVTAVIALTLYALLPMVKNTYTGIKNVDPQIIEAATGMGSTSSQLMFKIKIPLAFPYIFSGIRAMVTMTIALAGIASFVGAGGLGVAIFRGITTNNMAMTVVGSLLIAILALISDYLLGVIEKRIYSHGKSKLGIFFSIFTILIIGALVIPFFTSFGSKDAKVINIATKPMTEQYILGNMLETLIEDESDITVNVTQGVGGGTSNIIPGMAKGDFDMYPEYTGTGWNFVLKKDSIYSEDEFSELQSDYTDDLNQSWLGMYGFNNTYGIAVRTQVADEYRLKTISDLKKANGKLVFGGEYDFFDREDGFKALTDEYGLQFSSTKDMDIGLKYQAINDGQIDVMNIFTTDGQLSTSDIVVLEDDLNFYPSYLCGNVIRNETLEEYPELEGILEKLEASITDEEMSEMNNRVEEGQEDPEDVAIDFLTSKGLIESK